MVIMNHKSKFSLVILVAIAALSSSLSVYGMNGAHVNVAIGGGNAGAGSSSSNSGSATTVTAGTSCRAVTQAISGAVGKTIDAAMSTVGMALVASGSVVQMVGLGITGAGEWTSAKLRAYPTFTTCLTATAAGAVGAYLFVRSRR